MGKKRRDREVRLPVLPINRDIVWCYLWLLGMTKSKFLDRVIARNQASGKPGLRVRRVDLDSALRYGYAKHKEYALLLSGLQKEVLWAYGTEKLTRKEVPMITCLSVWPSKRLKDLYYGKTGYTRPRRVS